MAASKPELRWRIVRALFAMLYRNRTLYWLASTIPFAGQWRRWQRLVLPRLVGADILEVGCGIGTLLGDLIQAGYNCHAVDRSPQMVAAARSELRRRGFADGAARVVQADVRRLPFSDGSVDTVVSTFPTEYIFDPQTAHEIARVLRPGGRLVVVLGAGLEPTTPLVLPLVALQSLVYGRGPRHDDTGDIGTAGADNRVGPLGNLLTAAGLRPSSEQVRGPFWRAYLVLADKPAAGAV